MARYPFPKPAFQPGKMPSAPRLSLMAAGVNANANLTGSAPLSVRSTPEGHVVIDEQRHSPPIRMFELVNDMVFPTLPSGDAADLAQVPWSIDAKKTQLYSNASIHEYSIELQDVPSTIYFPQTFTNASGIAVGVPHVAAGDRVSCLLNTQSGRWECLAPPSTVWPFLFSGGTFGGTKGDTHTVDLVDENGAVPTPHHHNFTLENLVAIPDQDVVGQGQGFAAYMFGKWVCIQITCG